MSQPFLVLLGEFNVGGSYFIVVETEYLFLGNDPLHAINILFQTHFVFKLKYDESLELMYHVLEKLFYNIKSTNKSIPPQITDLIRNFKLHVNKMSQI